MYPQKTIEIAQRGSKLILGRLTTTIIAPNHFDVPVRETDASVRQAIRLNLQFERTSNDPDDPNPNLPQIQSLRGSVVATTFFTKTFHFDKPIKQTDRFGNKLNFADKVLTEFTHSITSLQWAEQPQPQSLCFVSTLLVPVKLSHQFIIPTFHSCRISRTYTLVLRLKVVGASTIKIAAPMQIAPSDELVNPPPYSAVTSI